jgi:hypothetical protein
MIHQIVDLKHWAARFPLDAHLRDLDQQGAPDFWYSVPDDINSPADLALTEQWRLRMLSSTRVTRGVATDLLLPALGEPTNRACSKLAGLPYLRRGEWPRSASGDPMAFLGQLCLADSRDVLLADRRLLPGDVLLIFQTDPEGEVSSDEDGSPLHFIWQPLGIPTDELITADELWEPEWWFEPLHFHRYRTVEYPQLALEATHREKTISLSGLYAASKIGGSPVFQQDEPDAGAHGTYFASLHSVNPYGIDYPLINVATSPWGESSHSRKFFMLGDAGTLYLFAKGDGTIGWLMQCG